MLNHGEDLRVRGRRAAAVSRLGGRRRLMLEHLEQRTVLSVSVAGSFPALDFNSSGGYTPPDTNGAVGPAAYVETVNQEIALYSKSTGVKQAMVPLNTFWFTTGVLKRADSGSGLSDPVVTYVDQIGRFVVGDQDVNFTTHVSTFDIAVSKTSTPASLSAADWNFYRIVTTETGYDADYPGNLGFNRDALVISLNMFPVSTGTAHVQIVSVSNADLQSGVATPATYKNDLNDFSVRPTTMHDAAAGDPMWLVTEHGDNKSIDVIKMANPLSATATFVYANLPVTAYSQAVYPLNPNGKAITTNMDSRILKAAEAGGMLVAAHTVAASTTQDVVQWYLVNLSSAAPTLQDQGRAGGASKTYSYFPGIDINNSGQIGLTYMKSGNDTTTDYMSMYVTGRNPTDPAGSMQVPVIVPAGTGVANYADFSAGGRAGDLSGINVDPTDGTFWAVNEFANTQSSANWGTAVAHFSMGIPLPATDLSVTATGPASVDVTAGPASLSYTITLTNNGPNPAQGFVLSDALPAGTTFVSLTQSSGTDTFTVASVAGKATASATADLAAGATDTFTLVVTAPGNLANGAVLTNTATVSASNPDSNAANNTATTTTTVVNTNVSSDLAVKITAPATGTEGGNLSYTITVTNNGPAAASSVVLTDTVGSLMNYLSSTATQGTISQTAGVVTFNLGTIAAGATITATVTAQNLEEGSISNVASVSSTTPDPNAANNTASGVTAFSEPAISVTNLNLPRATVQTNVQVATFTHAGGVEPPSAFTATINWGDGTTSTGAITLSGTKYTVQGTHTYATNGKYTVKTTVVEVGSTPNAPEVSHDKGRGDRPGHGAWNTRDVVKLPRPIYLKKIHQHHPKPPVVHKRHHA